MIQFSTCKINLGLSILEKRSDGFHNLQSVFYPIRTRDVLEIIESSDANEDIDFSQSGLQIEGSNSSNLCVKAYHLLKKDFPELPAIKMHLHKAIPMGAGLGGGSADGAFTLKLLNEKFNLQLSTASLIKYALELGSDCPFFIINKPCYATGRGENLNPVTLDLSSYKIFIINPGIHVNTGWAFGQLSPNVPYINLTEAINNPIEDWKHNIINDFEAPVVKTYPLIAEIKSQLYEQGALYASMSGSGSTVYGIFKKESSPQINLPESYFTKWV